MKINSDNSDASLRVGAIYDLLISSGAQIPNEMTALISSGNMQLSFEADIDKSNPPVFLLPEKCLVPLPLDSHFYDYNHETDSIEIKHRPSFLSDLQYEILQHMFSLYNCLGKVSSYAASTFWSSADCASSIWQPLYALRSQSPLVINNLLSTSSNVAHKSRALQYFLNSRVLGWVMTGDVQPKRVLIPLIDMANHHDNGAPFAKAFEDDLSPASLSFEMRKCDETNEVYATYGKKDSLDLFFNYSYPDVSTSILRSCPLSFQVSSKMHLSIGCTGGHLGAPIALREPGYVRLSTLMWDVRTLPGSMLIPLAKMFSIVGAEHLDTPDQVMSACKSLSRSIIVQNIDFYRNSISSLSASASDHDSSGSTVMSRGAICFLEQALTVLEHQLSLLQESLTFFPLDQL